MDHLLSAISLIMSAGVFITFIRNDYWVFKVMEYPRLQKLFLVIMILGVWAYRYPPRSYFGWISFVVLCAAGCYLVYKILPYTVFNPKEMKNVKSASKDNELRLFAANVYQDNRAYDRMLTQIRKTDPDIIFLLETDKEWAEAVAVLDKDYPYSLKEPLENTYGLILLSRLELKDARVNYLVKTDIPSVEATVLLRSGRRFKLWGLHPEPPVPGENLYATAKDKELMKVAFKARDCGLPCIVFGDLNDVAWSHTTELFRKTSNLLDPRRGRGFYSTFNAKSWFMRFPLDYIFCSKEFGFISMKRLPKNGSDHFATISHIALTNEIHGEQDPPEADGEELQEAKEKASKPNPA
jgi:endonuclease/exonuclease/phosphatase (EEP) superfamily protein YafD